MMKYERDIKNLQKEILKDFLDAIGSIIKGTVALTIEIPFQLVTLLWLYNLLEGKGLKFQSFDIFDDALVSFYCIREEKRKINILKKKQQEELIEEQLKQEPKKEVKPLNNFILEYIRDLLIKCKNLPAKAQLEFITRLKDILADYTKQYKETLENTSSEISVLNSMNLDILNQTTLKKLVVIEDAINSCLKVQDQIDSLTKEEAEVLSVIDITDEMKATEEQKQTLSI